MCFGSIPYMHTLTSSCELTCPSFSHDSHTKLPSVSQTHEALFPIPLHLLLPVPRRFLASPIPTGTLPPLFILSGSPPPFRAQQKGHLLWKALYDLLSLSLTQLISFTVLTTFHIYLFCYILFTKVVRQQETRLPCSSHHCILVLVSGTKDI